MAFKIDWAALNQDHDLNHRLVSGLNATIQKEILNHIPGQGLSLALDELDFGDEPPHLELKELKELSKPRVNVVFGFGYEGKAAVKFNIGLEMNPLKLEKPESRAQRMNRQKLGALSAGLNADVKMGLAVSNFRLEGTCEINLTQSDVKSSLTVSLQNQILQDIRISTTVFDGTIFEMPLSNFVKHRLQSVCQYARRNDIIITL